MFRISFSFFLAGVLAVAAEINGYVDIAKISTPSAAPTNFGRLYINTSAQLACINPDSSACLPTSTVLTQGSVMFAGASGVYSQDNANFFWDATNHRLGIGKNNPSNPLDVVGNVSITGVTQSAGTNSNFFQSLGTTFTVSGCATTSALTGGATSGSFSTTNVGTCTAVVTMGSSATASHGWSCVVNDQTTANTFRQTASTTTTATLVGTSANGDVINFHCVGY